MRNPKAIIEDTFEPIRPNKLHGHYRAKGQRKHLMRCNGKNSYRNEDTAASVRITLIQEGRATYLRVYRCPECVYWHLTHKRQKRK